jgi:hypothetical protein
VVLRCKDGRRVPGKLQVISLSGGLLCLPQPLDQGSQVKVMFLTRKGSVLGAAEMLSPISWGTQPFKFVKLYDDDQRRLDAAIQLSVEQNRLVIGSGRRTLAAGGSLTRFHKRKSPAPFRAGPTIFATPLPSLLRRDDVA